MSGLALYEYDRWYAGGRVFNNRAMPDGTTAGDFPSLNGPKVVPLPPRPAGATGVRLDYTMSAGFPGFTAAWV